MKNSFEGAEVSYFKIGGHFLNCDCLDRHQSCHQSVQHKHSRVVEFKSVGDWAGEQRVLGSNPGGRCSRARFQDTFREPPLSKAPNPKCSYGALRRAGDPFGVSCLCPMQLGEAPAPSP